MEALLVSENLFKASDSIENWLEQSFMSLYDIPEYGCTRLLLASVQPLYMLIKAILTCLLIVVLERNSKILGSQTVFITIQILLQILGFSSSSWYHYKIVHVKSFFCSLLFCWIGHSSYEAIRPQFLVCWSCFPDEQHNGPWYATDSTWYDMVWFIYYLSCYMREVDGSGKHFTGAWAALQPIMSNQVAS